MAKCKMCGRKGLFLWVSKNGLCKACDVIAELDIRQRTRIINDCMKLADKSKNIKTKLSRCDLLIEHAQVLFEYECKEIPTISPLPSQLSQEYTIKRDQIVLESTTTDVEKALAKAEIAATARTSINEANKALIKLLEAKKEIQDRVRLDKLDELEARVRHFSHETQLNAYIEEARKAEFKGQKKKALDQYQEALFFLRNDDIDDSLQEEKIRDIQLKISELSD